MKVSKNQSGNIGLFILMLVVGLGVGFAIGRVINNNKTTTTSSSSTAAAPAGSVSAKGLALHEALVTAGVEHMTLTDQAVDAALDGSSDATAVGTALYANGNAIGADVASVYGQAAGTQFDALWKLHLDQFVAYAVADSKGDAAGKTAALNAIDTGYTQPISKLLAGATQLPEATVQKLLGDHVTETAQIIDDHVQKNYTQEQTDLTAANTHIAAIFSALAGGIIATNSSKF